MQSKLEALSIKVEKFLIKLGLIGFVGYLLYNLDWSVITNL